MSLTNELPIKRILSEETRLGTILIIGQCYDLHQGLGDDSKNYYITKHANSNIIYAMITRELYEKMFN